MATLYHNEENFCYNGAVKTAVLIPAYNAARFLPKCLDSVLGQTFPDLEIRCCDDGSTDGTRMVLQDYAASFPNVHFVTQENAGVVAARNRLMDELPTDIEAFAFLDADDYVAPGMYAKLAEALERTGSDVAECEWDGEERVLDDMSVFLLRRTAPGRWINVINKLYRRSSVGNIRFRSNLAFEEDYFFNYEVHAVIRRKVLVPGFFYTYRTNPDSANGSLNLTRYFDSASRRLRLSRDVFLKAGRIPQNLEVFFRQELAKDLYRMCLRKNLKKNADATLRRQLFAAAGELIREFESDGSIDVCGLNPVQRALFASCRHGCLALARLISFLT